MVIPDIMLTLFEQNVKYISKRLEFFLNKAVNSTIYTHVNFSLAQNSFRTKAYLIRDQIDSPI